MKTIVLEFFSLFFFLFNTICNSKSVQYIIIIRANNSCVTLLFDRLAEQRIKENMKGIKCGWENTRGQKSGGAKHSQVHVPTVSTHYSLCAPECVFVCMCVLGRAQWAERSAVCILCTYFFFLFFNTSCWYPVYGYVHCWICDALVLSALVSNTKNIMEI